ncbi:ADP ribosylation factor interacting protein 1, transcript variant X5 [Ictidomys tridecemlineatus]|nr:ADP ribosylation factor interacting protein 1, transcript variant X5 [Ictidomys tridecemlineatus]
MWLLGPQPERRGQPLERGGGKFVRSALAPSRRGGAGPDLGRERPSRAKDHTTSGPLTSGFAALGAGSGGWVERSLVRVSSAVGQCEPVTAAVVPRPRGSEESTMAQESPKNSAAEIPVTSNGEVDDSHEHGFNRDLKRSLPSGLGLSETQITSHGFDSTKEGVIEAGAYQGSPAPPLPSVLSPSRVAASRLAQQGSDLIVPAGGQRTQTKSGPVILADEIKNPAMEKLELVRKWSLNTYKEEFGYNADTQKLLAKNGETLLGAINFFIASVNTLVNKTIEDTLMTVKQYESARIEYDAYRTDLEELNLGPRDANTLPKIEQSQHLFQAHKEKYDKMRNDVSIKLKFLEENKVKVLHNQLVLFHNAIAAYFAGNQKQLEQTLKQFHIKLKTPGVDAPSWLEEQ